MRNFRLCGTGIEALGISLNRMKRRELQQHTSKNSLPVAGGVGEGIVFVDSHFRLLALDPGAEAILSDLAAETDGVDSVISLPSSILALLGSHPVDELGAVRLHLSAGNREYSCRRFVVSHLNGSTEGPMLALHLKREISVMDTVYQVGKDYNLTDREQEALVGISMGLTSKELAERMNISPNTVKAFLRLIMLKMGTTTRSGIVGKLLGRNGHLVKHATVGGGMSDN
jgi:DNA-binding CsgD family transcriptional regulator